jgi:hypothetical protein
VRAELLAGGQPLDIGRLRPVAESRFIATVERAHARPAPRHRAPRL